MAINNMIIVLKPCNKLKPTSKKKVMIVTETRQLYNNKLLIIVPISINYALQKLNDWDKPLWIIII